MPEAHTPDKATAAQHRLEKKFGMPIRDLLIAELEAHKYQRNISTKIAFRLDINPHTLNMWCGTLGIDLNHYRYASPDQAPNLPVPV